MWSSGVSRHIGSFLLATELRDLASESSWEEPHPASEMIKGMTSEKDTILRARLAAKMGPAFVSESKDPLRDILFLEGVENCFSVETSKENFFACSNALASAMLNALKWKDRMQVLAADPVKRARNHLVNLLISSIHISTEELIIR
jgi:hypothetical protein